MVLKELILTISTLGECGGLDRILICNGFYFGEACGGLDRN